MNNTFKLSDRDEETLSVFTAIRAVRFSLQVFSTEIPWNNVIECLSDLGYAAGLLSFELTRSSETGIVRKAWKGQMNEGLGVYFNSTGPAVAPAGQPTNPARYQRRFRWPAVPGRPGMWHRKRRRRT
jgi:hypothetical protein